MNISVYALPVRQGPSESELSVSARLTGWHTPESHLPRPPEAGFQVCAAMLQHLCGCQGLD